MARKENHQKNHAAREAWKERKKAVNSTPVRVTAQRDYRIAALKQREADGRLTDNNREELSRLLAEIAR